MNKYRGQPLTINADRLLQRIAELAKIGRDPDGGISRVGFGDADREARSYLMTEVSAEGLFPTVDASGNILIRLGPPAAYMAERQVLLMGSHLDTVVSGGRLDGAYGVLAAVEVLQVLAEARLEATFDPIVVAFANEEGALFPQLFWGSMALAGRFSVLPREPLDRRGYPLREPLALAGGDLDAVQGAAWPPGSVAAYLELHVEQGPVLESSGKRIGIVDGISGRTMLTLEIRGVAGHAGTTPMDGRCDALAAAARVVLATESIAGQQHSCRVGTVGWMHVHPNTHNTIAGTVRITADLRDLEPKRLCGAEDMLRAQLQTIAVETGTAINVIAETRSNPVATDPALRAHIARAAAELDLPSTVLTSGAGHDAQMVADIAPVGMIFVPSINGVSHVPDEDTKNEDLIAGAQVLLRTALRLEGLDE